MKLSRLQSAGAFVSEVAFASLAFSQLAKAQTCSNVPSALCAGVTAAQPTGAKDNLFTQGGLFQTIANVLIFIVGAVSVIMLIVGGLRYVLSSGNASAVEGAKNTILFAIIGVVVAALAFAIVSFVVSKLG